MRKLLRYIILFTGIISFVIIIKSVLLPYLIWKTLPKSDFGSTLYEVSVMSIGAVAVLAYLTLGYIGKHSFRLSPFMHHWLNLIVLIPFLFHSLINEIGMVPKNNLYAIFAGEWSGLIGEPIRLLLFVHPWTDTIGILIGYLLISIGRAIRLEEDNQWRRGTVQYIQHH